MQRRWIAGLVLVGAASVGLYLATRGGDKASSAPEPVAAPERNAPPPTVAREQPPERVGPRKQIPLDLGKGDPSPGVKKWKEEGLPGTFREIVAPDDSVNHEEKLTYKLRRLRFELTDAAADCYTGGKDGHEQVILSYDLVVKAGVLSVDNLQVLSSTFSDRALETCIVESVRTMRRPATDIPDMIRPQRTVIDQQSLYAANHRG